MSLVNCRINGHEGSKLADTGSASHAKKKSTPDRGEGYFATERILAGHTGISAPRTVMAALDEERLHDHCDWCYRPVTPFNEIVHRYEAEIRGHRQSRPVLTPCAGCEIVRYCSDKCADSAYLTYHKAECSMLRRFFYHLTARERAILRVVTNFETGHLHDSTWNAIQKMESHEAELQASPDTRWEQICIMAETIHDMGVRRCDLGTIRGLICRFDVNAVPYLSINNEPIGLFANITLAKINHSCEPNLVVDHEDVGGRLFYRAVKDIEIGEELTISYLPSGLPLQLRRDRLKDYFFECACPKCIGEGVNFIYQEHLNTIKKAQIRATELSLRREYALPPFVYAQKLGYAILALFDTGIWDILWDPLPFLLRQFAIINVVNRQYNTAFACAALLYFDINPELYPGTRHHPQKKFDSWLLIRTIALIRRVQDGRPPQNLNIERYDIDLIWWQRFLVDQFFRDYGVFWIRMRHEARKADFKTRGPESLEERDRAMPGMRVLLDDVLRQLKYRWGPLWIAHRYYNNAGVRLLWNRFGRIA